MSILSTETHVPFFPTEVLRYIHPVGRYVFIAAMVLFLSDVAQNRGWIRQRHYPNWTSSINRRYFSLAACAWIFALCFVVLLVSWTNGGTQDYSAIGGLIPHSDAAAYFEGAERLLQDGTLTNVSERRPLNAAFFAARLLIANENFYYAMILQAAIVALALFLASRQMHRLQGSSIAFVFLAINFAFANNCLPRTLSESLGISLGLIAFTLYCSSIARRSKTEYALGTAILTLALLARAGAMFALAASVVFALFFFADSWKARCSAVALTLAGIAFGWLIIAALVRMYGDSGLILSNFSYVIYGLSQGGKGWQQAAKDLPLTGNEAQIAAMLYQRTFESILSNPLLMVVGLAKSLSLSLLYFPAGLLRLIAEAIDGGTPRSLIPSALVAALLIPPLLDGTWRLLTKKPFVLDPIQWFFLLQLTGFIASLPFFYLDGGIRLTAATFPFTAAAIVLILAACKSAPALTKTVPARSDSYQAVAMAVVIVVTSLAAPQIGRMRSSEPGIEPITCEQGDQEVRMLVGAGTAHINILDDDVKSVLPNIRRPDFQVAQSNEIIEFWQSLDLPATILLGLDHNSRQTQIVVGLPGFADGPRRLAAICTKPLRDRILLARAAKKDR
jgi:hypothetical protein